MSKVLIVDDEKIIRNSFSKQLEKENIEVWVASNWDEAKPIILKYEFDCIFLDNKMPGKYGIDVVPDILKIDKNITIIIMTGDPSAETTRTAFQHGAIEYLSKPITKNQLLKITFESIKRKKLLKQKNKLEENNEKFQEGLDYLISTDGNELESEEFRNLAQDLISHRKKHLKS